MASDPRDGDVSRRDFIRTSAVAAAVGLSGCEKKPSGKKVSKGAPPQRPQPAAPKTGRAKVVLVRDEHVLDARGRARAKVLAPMLDRAVTELVGNKTVSESWATLLAPKDVLGIKTNVWKYLRTPVALETAIAARARGVGIPASAIHVDDRGARTTLSQCTALINARPLRSHDWSGIGGCLKNYIMFVARPWKYHAEACADLGKLWTLPVVKGKTRLNVLVMLTPQFHGRGPHHFSSQYVWPYRGLIVSTDPVAADRIGLEILRAKRRAYFSEDKPFSTRTHHVELADTRHGVGIADPKRIDLVKLGWKKDLLLPG